jgi:hypothetical protein
MDFHILDLIKIRNGVDPVEILTGSKQFQSIASRLILSKIQIILGEQAKKEARRFTISISSTCRLSCRQVKSQFGI